MLAATEVLVLQALASASKGLGRHFANLPRGPRAPSKASACPGKKWPPRLNQSRLASFSTFYEGGEVVGGHDSNVVPLARGCHAASRRVLQDAGQRNRQGV